MKSYKVVEFGKPLQKVEEANPAPQGTEVLVRITAAGVCHSDVHLWEGYFDMGGGNKSSTEKAMAPPRTMGHEIVGEVAALGPDAKGAKVGDKAVVYPWIGCGKCWYCQAGSEHLCRTPRALGLNKDGGFADHVLVPHAKYLIPTATCRSNSPASMPAPASRASAPSRRRSATMPASRSW